MEQATVACFFLDVTTTGPLTMMELWLWAQRGSKKVVVCGGSEFRRAANVKLICNRYNTPFEEEFGDAESAIDKRLEEKGMRFDKNGGLVG
jgi:hypothetical protein